MKTKAFSLVEMILYIGITTLMVVCLLMYMIRITQIRGESENKREVLENARFVLDLISREIHDAQGVSTGTFDTHPGSLTLTADSGTIVIDTSTKVVDGTTLRFLQVNSGSGALQATSDKVNVSGLIFRNLTRDVEPENIQVEITLESIDATETVTFRTSINLRE